MELQVKYPDIDEFLTRALREDIGSGDVTSRCCVPEDASSSGVFLAKEAGVICGLEVAARVFRLLDGAVSFKPLVSDGDAVSAGEAIAEISGPSRSILAGERTALNLLRRLSGIATRTAAAVKGAAGGGARVTDTRKTTPGMRALEKYAVRCGGGFNHRFGLYDGILIKDNHIAAAGGVAEAVARAKKNAPHTLRIEVETESLEQIAQALEAGADIIMLDNMPVPQMAEAVRMIGGRALTEASGNIGERDIAEVAASGVDIISVGALTHSVRDMDISLKFLLPEAEGPGNAEVLWARQ
ncbi:MAG: carboxylating nicotinate-nucleotide diphosphorylase [Oscillospiraceae bacterium]|jgi:nicotinate-nucleotide pyrophosphorylase (carboxylating)|nr:carboxylating nicotinate-nucleotide diphosphorylase [Oscillospiraceae bacterium]